MNILQGAWKVILVIGVGMVLLTAFGLSGLMDFVHGLGTGAQNIGQYVQAHLK